MDKYDFSIKVEQLKKLARTGDYENAIKIADAIDWRRVQDSKLLQIVSEVYENNAEYGEAKEILLLAYERAGLGRRFLYKLVELAVKEGSLQEAESYYREFQEIAAGDSRIFLLRYQILSAKNAPIEQRINALEEFNTRELDEKYMYELAKLYYEAGLHDECLRACDNIMLMFGLGKYVDKAMSLKTEKLGVSLNEYQQGLVDDKEGYEDRLRAVEDGEFPSQNLGMGFEGIQDAPEEREEFTAHMGFEAPNEDELNSMKQLDEEIAKHIERLDTFGVDAAPDPGFDDIKENGYSEEFGGIEDDLRSIEENTNISETEFEVVEVPEYEEPEIPEPESTKTLEPKIEEFKEFEQPEQVETFPEIRSVKEGSLSEALPVQNEIEPEISPAQPEVLTEASAVQEEVLSEVSSIGKEVPEPSPIEEEISLEASPVREITPEPESKAIQEATALESEPVQQDIVGEEKSEEDKSEEEFSTFDTGNKEELSEEKTEDIKEPEPVKEDINPVQEPDVKDTAEDILKVVPKTPEVPQIVVEEDEIEAPGYAVHRKEEKLLDEAEEPKDIEDLDSLMDGDEDDEDESEKKQERLIYIVENNYKSSLENASIRLKEIHAARGVKRQAIKIKASKLNGKNLEEVFPKIAGKDLIIEEAGDLSFYTYESIKAAALDDKLDIYFALVDNQLQLNNLKLKSDIAKKEQLTVPNIGEDKSDYTIITTMDSFEKEEGLKLGGEEKEFKLDGEEKEFKLGGDEPRGLISEELGIDDFAAYASDYATSIDCVITGKSMLALYEKIEMLQDEHIPLTKENAIKVIEEAADKAENPKIFKRIRNFFMFRDGHDKEGRLVLEREHFVK